MNSTTIITRLLTLERLLNKAEDNEAHLELNLLHRALHKALTKKGSHHLEKYRIALEAQEEQEEQNAVKTIENAFLNALYNPRTPLGIKRLNRDYDELF